MITRRRMLAATGLALATAGRAGARESTGPMMIKRSGSEPSTKGSADYFTVDHDQVGSTITGSDLTVTLYYREV